MAQQIINEEGAFSSTIRDQINNNFSQLYTGVGFIPIILRQTSDLVKTSDTSVAILPGLYRDGIKPGTYKITIDLQINSTVNGGVNVALGLGPTTSALNIAVTTYSAGSAPLTTLVNTNGPGYITLRSELVADVRLFAVGTLIITDSLNNGTVEIIGAQNTSSVDTTTFYAGSSLELENTRF